jgi:hypothetical protein
MPVLAPGIATLDLIVPVELTDQPLASNQNEVIFEGTQTSFNPDDYDGTKTFTLETIAINLDSVDRTLKWIDWYGNETGVVVIPAGTANPTLLRGNLNVSSGDMAYRLKTENTTDPGQLQIFSARLMVKQVGATKTKLYFPLLSKQTLPNAMDSLNPIFSTSDTGFSTLSTGQRFTRNLAAQSILREFNSWELEAVVSAQQDSIGSFALRNVNQSALVEDSQTYFKSNTITLSRVPISEGLENFSLSNEGDQYDLVMRCELNCQNQVQIYKAGLWLRVQDLSKVEVTQRLTLGASYPEQAAILADARVKVSLVDYSNPTFGFSVTGSTPMMTMLDVTLSSAGASSSSTSSLTPVAGSVLSFGLPELMTQVTPMNLTPNSGDYLVVEVNAQPGAVVREAGLVIRAHR